MTIQPTLREVLSQLADEGLAKPLEQETVVAFTAPSETQGSSLPWFVKLFIGGAAWIALLIVSFFFAIGIIDDDSALGFGLVFCAAAILVNRAGHRNTFWVQLSLAASLTGQVLTIIGLFSLFDYDFAENKTLVVTLIILFQAILIWLHRDSVLRFISTIIITSFILWLILDSRYGQGIDAAQFFLRFYIVALAVMMIALSLMEHRLKMRGLGGVHSPVFAGVVVSFLGILTMPLFDQYDMYWQIPAILFAAMLAYLFSVIALDLGYNFRNRVVIALLAGCALLLIPSLQMPGILAALIVLVLGFWRNNQGLVWLAAIFLIFYISAFYYSLEWTLLVKSLVLLASGLVLLGLRFFVVKFTAQSGEQS